MCEAPEQVLQVGDDHEVDVVAAPAAGPDTEVERAPSLAELAERPAR